MKNKHNYPLSIVRAATIVPKLSIGNIDFNTKEICEAIEKSGSQSAGLIILPELAVTGYTLGDLFHNDSVAIHIEESLQKIATCTKNIDATIVVGAPIQVGSLLANAAVVISQGEIKGIVPKLHLPNYKEFYERRWFTSGYDFHEKTVTLGGSEIPFGYDLIFNSIDNQAVRLGVEICEDLWMPLAPSSYLSLAGATLIANLSASNELVGKANYRRDLVIMQSAKTVSGYVYVSSGVHESTTDVVFGGHTLMAENGSLIAEGERFSRDTVITYGDIDIDHLAIDRGRTNSFAENIRIDQKERTYRNIKVAIPLSTKLPLLRPISPTPFLPSDTTKRKTVTEEIFNIQVAGLAKRFESSRAEKAVIGLSGGLDSTLAFLVCLKTFEKLGLPTKNIHAITMPGFGTTTGTKNNATILANVTDVSFEEISIVEGVTQHFKDISHDETNEDFVFENSQARYRTMILFDKANMLNGLVIGTGDLSESALGWCTFGGDHLSSYNVNGSIPKTLIKYVVEYVASISDEKLKKVLTDIIETPISPELKSAKNDKIVQKTEDIIGPYILHDFFLYHFIRWGSHPKKIEIMAEQAFAEKYSKEEIKKWLKEFITRFFKNQWKRSVMPDGPKVGTVSLSPRGDWRMPSDADVTLWMTE